MTKYQAGDKVQVRNDLEVGVRYFMESVNYSDSATPEMMQFSGEVVTIEKVEHFNSGCSYLVKEDGNEWNWTDGMFENVRMSAESLVEVPVDQTNSGVVDIFSSSKKRAPSQRETLLKMLRGAGSEGVLNTRMVKYCIGYRSRLAELYQMGYVVNVEHIESGLCRYTLISEPEHIKTPKNAFDMLFEIIGDSVVDSEDLKRILKENNFNIVRKHGAHKMAV